MYKKLNCPNCGNDILSSDINLDKGLAKCSSCHVLFNVEKEVEDAPRKKEIFVIPKGIEVLRMFSELNIDMKWRHNTNWFLMTFTLLWNGILLPMALFIILSGEFIGLLFMSVHIAIGLGLIYWSLAALVNTTFIVVDEHYISIQHRPFKLFFKEFKFETRSIHQLYVKKYSNGKTNGVPNYVYGVMAILDHKEEIKIIKGLRKPNQAMFIEQEIEKFIGIKDQSVIGEI